MLPKFIVATLSLSLALFDVSCVQAAGESGLAKAAKRPAHQSPARNDGEDVLARDVFQVLVGEFALLRGEIKLGVEAWSDLALRRRDPLIFARATEVASFARQYDTALELSRRWLEVDPDSAKAQQAQSSLFVLANRLDDLAPQLSGLLAQEPANLGNNLLQLNRLLVRHGDKQAVQKLIDRVAQPYVSLPEAHFAMAQAAAGAGDHARALHESATALALRPEWEAAALLQAQLQARQSAASAIDGLQDFVGRYPEAGEARLTLARLLISEKRYDEARLDFERLIKRHPDSPELLYPLAMLALQRGDVGSGRQRLEKLLHSEFPDKSALHYFLAQIDEEQARPLDALAHYRQVVAGEQFVPAKARAAHILQVQGRLAEAQALLQEAAAGASAADQSGLLFAEVQLLRESGQESAALARLESALAAQPDSPELLYETALLADRQGRPEILEARLRHLLALQPEHAHALNALGYSWAERNIHLLEAEAMIARALKLAPEDPFIMDSLGWVFYRQGRLAEAEKALAAAYRIKDDPEIAAHLGEVLWDLKRQDEARRLLQDAAHKYPENSALAAVVKKLLP